MFVSNLNRQLFHVRNHIVYFTGYIIPVHYLLTPNQPSRSIYECKVETTPLLIQDHYEDVFVHELKFLF